MSQDGASALLLDLVERYERADEEDANFAADIGFVYDEAKHAKFPTKWLRQLIRLRALSASEQAARANWLVRMGRALSMCNLPVPGHNGGPSGDDLAEAEAERLRHFVARIERLEEERKNGPKQTKKDIKAEAKGKGFDVKTLMKCVNLRKLSPAERDEQDALLDIYKAALGMLADTPLGLAAQRRLTRKPAQPTDAPADDDDGSDDDGSDDAMPGPVPEDATATPEEARAAGADAARQGVPVTANPHPPHTAARAAWDEGWCQANGSDGMEIPAAWRRASPKKPAEGPVPTPNDTSDNESDNEAA